MTLGNEAARILADQLIARGLGKSDVERVALARILTRFAAEQRKAALLNARAALESGVFDAPNPRHCVFGCGLLAADGDVYCEGCRSGLREDSHENF